MVSKAEFEATSGLRRTRGITSFALRQLLVVSVKHGERESVPIQLAQCWFPGLVIFNAEIKIHGCNFIKQCSETVID